MIILKKKQFFLLCFFSILLTGCVSFSDEDWRTYVAHDRCNGMTQHDTQQSASLSLPYYLVTSRLPDCRDRKNSSDIRLTIQRGDAIRFGRFSAPANKKGLPPLRFEMAENWWDMLNKDLSAVTNQSAHGDAEMAKWSGRVMLFVHGYNNSFSETAARTDKIARKTGFKGPIVHFSWPSHERVTRYTVDETNSDWNRDYFNRIVEQLIKQDNVKDLILVSHSMTRRSAVDAVEYIDQVHPKLSPKIKTIILASSDIDRAVFEQRARAHILAPKHVANGRRVTAYTSNKDRAIWASKFIHGYGRLGITTCIDPNIVSSSSEALPLKTCYAQLVSAKGKPMDGLHVVDTSNVRSNYLGHSDFIDSAIACTDFARIVNGDDMQWNGREKTPFHNAWKLSPSVTATDRCMNNKR